jgi:gluconate 5-dehydrogenase
LRRLRRSRLCCRSAIVGRRTAPHRAGHGPVRADRHSGQQRRRNLGRAREDYPREAWNKVVDLNVTALFLLTQEVARAAFLKQGKGAVINLASVEGLQGHHPDRLGTIAYNTSKGAVINMTRALAAEWGPHNIRVNALAPGFFPSKMTAATLAEHGEEALRQTPLGKLGGDTILMGAALLLASDAGGHITGQTLVVDGGATIV